jgi:acetyltransferase-like isoleucine patch superfamily enzyme
MSLPISSDVLPSGLGAAGAITLVTPCDDDAFTLTGRSVCLPPLNPAEKVEIDLCMHLSYRSQAKTQLLQVAARGCARALRRASTESSIVRLSDLRTTGVLAVVRRELRPLFSELRRLYFNKLWGMDIGPDCRISFSAKLDKSYPSGVHIGESTAINFGACVLTHDTTRRLHVDTWIGKECNIGAHSIIIPG